MLLLNYNYYFSKTRLPSRLSPKQGFFSHFSVNPKLRIYKGGLFSILGTGQVIKYGSVHSVSTVSIGRFALYDLPCAIAILVYEKECTVIISVYQLRAIFEV